MIENTQHVAGEAAATAPGWGRLLGRAVRVRETGLILVILALFVVMSLASPYFLTWENMRAMTMAFAVEGIVVAPYQRVDQPFGRGQDA